MMPQSSVLFGLYGCEDMPRAECPLSDAELYELQRWSAIPPKERRLEIEWELLCKLDNQNNDGNDNFDAL